MKASDLGVRLLLGPPLKASDLGVRLLLGPLDGRDTTVPSFAPVTSLAGSPRQGVTPPNFLEENLEQHPDDFVMEIPSDVGPPVLDVGTSTL